MNVAELEALLAAPDPEARRAAVQRLSQLADPRAAALLVIALGDSDWRVRKDAAAIAPGLARRDDVVHALTSGLANTENIGLRNASVEALVAIGRDAVEATIDALAGLDADGRKLAVEALAGIPDERSAAALSRALSDEDSNVRAAAAEGLGSAGLASEASRQTAVDALIAILSPAEPLLTLAALDTLSRLDAKLPWSTFEPFANDSLFRRHAILAAARSRDEAALLALVAATGDASTTIAREALLSLPSWLLFAALEDETLDLARAEMQKTPAGIAFVRERAKARADSRTYSAALVALAIVHDERDLTTLVEALADPEVAEHASAALEMFGRSAAHALAKLLPLVPQQTRAVLLSLIPRLSRGAADSRPRLDSGLLQLLRDGLDEAAAEVAAASARGLASSGEQTDLGRLVPIVAHSEARVALAASAALRTLAARFPDAARQLLRALDPDGEHAAAGCALVAAIAETRPDQLTEADTTFVTRVLTNGNSRSRRVAIDTIALLGERDAADAVAFALADEERDVRLAAVRALGKLGRADPLAALVTGSNDQELVAAALRALSEADPGRGFAAARALLRSGDVSSACVAVEAIGSSALPAREAALTEALDHDDPEVVKAAMNEISRAPTVESFVRLAQTLEHPSWEVRRLASELLAHVHEAKIVELLRMRLEREKEPIVREALNAALSLPPPSFEGS